VGSLVATSVGADKAAPTAAHSLARAIYAELVGLNTANVTGSTGPAAAAVAGRLRAAGYGGSDVQVLGPKPTKANLVARLHGTGVHRPLLLLAHLDVVEANRSDWTFDPFALTEQDGFFYGRGTLDDKAMAAIFVTSMIRMKREGVRPNRDVILALTADEEGGPDNGVEWLLRHHHGLVDAELVLNEGGIGAIQHGRYVANLLQASEKTYTNFTLEVRDKGGHSSLPSKENAIYRLAAGLERLERYAFPVELNEVTRRYFERLATLETGQTADDMLAVLRDPPDAAAVARLSETPRYNAVLRTTCVATRLEAGHADNALPQTARANVNCRILPGHTSDEVRRVLIGVLADDHIMVTEPVPAVASPASAVAPDVMAATERVTRELWPGIPVIPIMSTGATDARYFRTAGSRAYGVSGIFIDVDDNRAHGQDERLGVRQFYEGQEFLYRLVLLLVGGEHPSEAR
jgi:acetylornithine deacetylase/succinyl-diaminopimelate desuccinylase-like protein